MRVVGDAGPGDVRARVKRRIPPRLWRPLSDSYWWWLNRGRHRLAWAFSSERGRSRSSLERFEDLHQGQRGFILGNGPSLQRTDLSLLRDEITFGMNRIYLAFDSMGFSTTYYVSVNTLVIGQCAEEIRALTMPKFVTWRGREWLGSQANLVYLDTDYTGAPTFSTDARGRIFEGSTVTYVALQLAFHMGFKEVILIGVDHRFSAKGPANATVESQEGDRDHFSPSYFGPGFRWQLPDLEASEAAYRLARQKFEASGRRVLDATVGGALEVFSKVDYRSLFGSKRQAG